MQSLNDQANPIPDVSWLPLHDESSAPSPLRDLVRREFSSIVLDAFLEKGHDA